MNREQSYRSPRLFSKLLSESNLSASAILGAVFSGFIICATLLSNNVQAQYEKSDWRELTTNSDVEFTGASIFSLATTLFVDDQGFLWDTWDTAMTLKPHYLDVINSKREPLKSVRFTDVAYNTDSSGFICGEQGVLLQTKDWGRNWKQRYFKNLDLLYFYDIHFINRNQGVLIGVSGSDSLRFKGIIYRTDDGGDTWTEVTGVQGMGFSRVSYNFESKQLVITAIGSILISDDKGKTWQTVVLPEGDLVRATDINGDYGIAVGMNGRLLLSEDGGQKWKDAKSPTESNLLNISRYAIGYWYIVGEEGEVWKTVDFGKTWTDMRINKKIKLNGVKRMGPRLVVWGDDGTIMVRGLGGRK